MSKTKIVATIGPASNTKDKMRALAEGEEVGDTDPFYIVYDTSLYNYSEVLNLAHAYSAMPQSGSTYVGTLYPDRQMILTNLHIFTL